MSKLPYSQADYSPINLKLSMEFFHTILNGRPEINGGQSFEICSMTFVYDTILGVKDDPLDPHKRVVLRKHPTCVQPIISALKNFSILQRRVTKNIKFL